MTPCHRLCPPAPAEGLRSHSAALRTHAGRLRAGLAALDWRGPQADAFRAEVTALADRCATAADGFALAAAQLDGPEPRRR
ncbi:WXG100 family type VII secretion target [Streptomyces sp. RerS4]|uniref:WXG100 family type VII secretion target n=1 Tax=Streptomyces sp. RerS4 TaxID=2942449 RepID=UPI00201BA6F0|nr:WXG100 family type VII secretion target [Streptomyces sp. RerS4]UQX04330.1 WXG100 family type VII secretion target [Streptomyces sp. RerS4]